jgi:hypothetical protein
MAIHTTRLPGGVNIISEYDGESKEFPENLKNSPDWNNYNWIGNFGLKGFSAMQTVPEYEIQVPKNSNKDLVYWDESRQKTVKFSSTNNKLKDIQVNNLDYKSAKLTLGDPPIGWAF